MTNPVQTILKLFISLGLKVNRDKIHTDFEAENRVIRNSVQTPKQLELSAEKVSGNIGPPQSTSGPPKNVSQTSRTHCDVCLSHNMRDFAFDPCKDDGDQCIDPADSACIWPSG